MKLLVYEVDEVEKAGRWLVQRCVDGRRKHAMQRLSTIRMELNNLE